MSTEMEEALEKHETKEYFSKSSFVTFMLPPIIVLLFGLGCLIVDGKFIWWAFAPFIGCLVLWYLGESFAFIRVIVGLLMAGEIFLAVCIAISAFVGHPLCGIGFTSTGFLCRLIGVLCGIYAIFGFCFSLLTIIGADNMES